MRWSLLVHLALLHPRQRRIRRRDFVQPGLGDQQHQGQAVVLRGLREGGKAGFAQQGVEFGNAVLPQQEHGGNVEGTGQGLVGVHGAVVLFVEVLGSEAAQVYGNVREQGIGQDYALVQGGGIQERLQDAAGRTRGGGNVHLHARALTGRGCIPHIRQHLSGAIIHDHRGHVGNAFQRQFVGAAVHRGLHGFLQGQAQGTARAHPLGAAFHVVRGPRRQRQRRFRQRLFQCRFIGVGR